MKLILGKQAPDFTLQDQNGVNHTLSNYQGRRVLIYFYPKDDTPGCTKEACNFRDNIHAFKKSKIQIFGISIDPIKRHDTFAKKYALPFPILSDENKKVVEDYGVWAKKKFVELTTAVRELQLTKPTFSQRAARIIKRHRRSRLPQSFFRDIRRSSY